jgi:hypothetical protein
LLVALSVGLLPVLERRSRVVGCFVAFSRELLVAFISEKTLLCRLVCRILPRGDAALSVTSSPFLERRSRFVGCCVASSREMTPLCRLLFSISLSADSSHPLKKCGSFVGCCFGCSADRLSPSLAKRSRFVTFSREMTPLFDSPLCRLLCWSLSSNDHCHFVGCSVGCLVTLSVALSVASSLFLKR